MLEMKDVVLCLNRNMEGDIDVQEETTQTVNLPLCFTSSVSCLQLLAVIAK